MNKENIVPLLPSGEQVCFVIPKLFSQQECETLLNSEIRNSFQKAHTNYPTYYRNNDRLVIDDELLAGQLFEKVKSLLPQTIRINSPGPVENGIWHLQELNSRIRFCRYGQGQYFNRHLDGVHFRSKEVQSKLTFMLYLNSADEFTGGRTLFYQSKEIWASYLPRKGDLIVFDHNFWHEGEMLMSGEKFVLRSDIIYKLQDAQEHPQSYLENYQEGHLGYIWNLLLFDEHTLLSAGRDKLIKVWNEKGECKQRLDGHQNSILCLARLNENTFLSGSRDRTIKIWKQDKDTILLKAEILIHHSVVLSLCRINNNTFASSGGDNLIHICDLEGRISATLAGHTDWVWNVIKLKGHLLGSCSEDKSIGIWNYQESKCIARWQEDYSIQCLAFESGSDILISGNFNGEISIYKPCKDYENWEKIRVFKGHEGIIRTLLILDEHYLASGGEDNKVRIWDLADSSLVEEFHHFNFVQSLVILPQKKLISASYDGKIKLWDLSRLLT